eukprot:gnl/MRDRNA2_/MRDRNA2_66331_c0_seq1.p1 gnl/MRDRNA2_/MRDRNA2_66331_c0~~gnl/MRDRNA2_/MRDRNA2_66331_c0_seq1.p1  ORF type:complete len:430 (+),score=57.65 gnl/MRDRNA2_/MRDRNA2_66331_c0_seq1:92-1381(+)
MHCQPGQPNSVSLLRVLHCVLAVGNALDFGRTRSNSASRSLDPLIVHDHGAEVGGASSARPNAPTLAHDRPRWQCSTGSQWIPSVLLCDGSADCTDGSDEARNQCVAADLPPYNEAFYRVYQPPTLSAPDTQRYRSFYEAYQPELISSLPRAVGGTASVEVYYMDAWHSNPLLRLIGFRHHGMGLLLRSSEGRELGRVIFQWWPLSGNLTGQPLLGKGGAPQHNSMGHLLFGQRGVVTTERSRGNWEGDYWFQQEHVKTLDVSTYNEKLRWLEKWSANHSQFLDFGVVDLQGNIVLPSMACTPMLRAVLKEFAGVDPFTDFLMPQMGERYVKGEVVHFGMDAEAARKLLLQNPEAGLVAYIAAYHPDGTPWEQHDAVSKVHLVRPVGSYWVWSYGMRTQQQRFYGFLVVAITALLAGCVWRCWPASSVK